MGNAAAGICRRLTEDIVSGALPPGQKLEELVLAERFEVSRTPIREALRELHARGLIELTPRKGGIVRSIGLPDLADMLEAMVELEALCCRISAQRMGAVQKKQLQLVHEQSQDCVARDDQSGYLVLNRQFHQLLAEGTQNRNLMAMLDGLRERLSPFRAAQTRVERRLTTADEEHRQILSAILASQPEQAYEAMRQHTARLSTNVLELLRQSREDAPASAAAPGPTPTRVVKATGRTLVKAAPASTKVRAKPKP